MASFAYCGRTLFLRFSLIVLAFFSVDSVAGQASSSSSSGSHYRGRYIGPITAQKHKVSGEVYAVDSRTLHIRGFTYDGTGPDAFFWTGFTEHPSSQGVIIPNERGTKEVLGAYNNQDITISLPDGLTLRDIKWIAVWCRAYEVNFGDLYIPLNLDYPQPHVVGSLVGQQGVTSGPIVVVDAQTILVPDFTYDGQAPDLHFWVGRGVPGPQGVRVPDETGTDGALQKADKKTMVLSLPGDLTVFDVDYFGVWCRLYSIDFGHVRITPGLNVPPSLRMLGVAPQSKLNCEVLHEDAAFEIRWSVVESGETIVFQLVGRLDNGKYMAVGLSGEDDRSVMLGGDAMVGYFDQAAQRGNVVDYHLGGKSVCQQNNKGACPDVRFKEGANNVRLLSAASVNGFTILTFQRKLQPLDGLDKKIRTNESQPIIWAIGNLMPDNLAGYHEIRNRDDISIDFGRSPKWNCPEPEKEPEFVSPPPPPSPTLTTTASPLTTVEQDTSASHQQQKEDVTIIPPAWRIPPIPCSEPDDGVFYLHVGPIGRPDIFKGVTGKKDLPETVWYVNGLLMPEIHLVRGKNYTFVIQGGPDNGFYITDSQTGDYQHAQFDPSRRPGIFGGVELDPLGNGRPTALGKLCRWVETKTESPNAFASYAAYQRTLSLDCAKGHSGILSFTPDKRTPNLVYYQSFSRPNMGWKIHITDHCGAAPTNETPQIQHVIDQNIGESSRVEAFFPQQQQQPNIVALSDMTHQMNSHIPQNAYIIDTTTMDGSGSSFLPHFIFKGNNKLASPPQSQAAPPQRYNGNGLTFPFPPQSAPGVYQIAVDTTSPDNHPHRSQPGFSPQIVPDTHFLRRNGPPPPPPPTMQPYQYAPQSESNYFQGGPTRPPPPQVRYEPQQQQYNNNHQQYHPHPQQQQPVMYVTTMAPQQQYHHQFVTTMGPLPPPPPQRRYGGMHDGPPTGRPQGPPRNQFQHEMYHPQMDARLSPAAPPAWVHTRNLPKRENSGSGDVTPFLRRGVLRDRLKRVARGFREEEDVKEDAKENAPISASQADEMKNGPLPVFFFTPVFRASPPDRISNGSMSPEEEGEFVNQLPVVPPMMRQYHRHVTTMPPFSLQKMYKRPMKKKNNALRELLLLRKPMTARIPQLVTFPGPKFGKLSPPQQMRRVHNVMRPRNDHIGATFSVPQLSPVMQTSTMATNVSLVVLDDEGNQDDNNGDEDINLTTRSEDDVVLADDKIIPGSISSSSPDPPNNGGGEPSQLSLTLLTDVWQIINNQIINQHGIREPRPKKQVNIPAKMIIKVQRNMIREILGAARRGARDFPFGGEKQHQNEDDEDTKNFQEEELFKPTNISNSVQPTEGFARA